MKKVIFRESDYTDYDILYDNDGITNESGKNNALYVIVPDGYRDYVVTNKKEYEGICNQAENIANDFSDFANGYDNYFTSYKAILNYYGVKYSPATVSRLKKWSEAYKGSIDDIAAFLTITTGEKWNTYGVCGYCQGDYATGIYCEGHYTKEALELYVGAAAGTVSEFIRIEGDDICGGFFVTDSVKWNTEALKKELASYEGDDPENITIQLFDGYTQTAKYTEV